MVMASMKNILSLHAIIIPQFIFFIILFHEEYEKHLIKILTLSLFEKLEKFLPKNFYLFLTSFCVLWEFSSS